MVFNYEYSYLVCLDLAYFYLGNTPILINRNVTILIIHFICKIQLVLSFSFIFILYIHNIQIKCLLIIIYSTILLYKVVI